MTSRSRVGFVRDSALRLWLTHPVRGIAHVSMSMRRLLLDCLSSVYNMMDNEIFLGRRIEERRKCRSQLLHLCDRVIDGAVM